jgi:hypothetical protein
VEGEIERQALATATMILNASTSQPAPLTPADRDAYCESQAAARS